MVRSHAEEPCFPLRVGCPHLEDGSVVEQGQQLQQVVQDVALLLLHPQDVGGVEGLRAVHLQLLVEWEKPKLEEVLDDNGYLGTRTQTVSCGRPMSGRARGEPCTSV